MDCIFCKIVSREIKSYKIYEDEDNIAFLDVFPLVEGQTIVTTKKHYGGYIFDMPDYAYTSLWNTVKVVSKMLDKNLPAERTMVVVSGVSVEHNHIKLFPVQNVKSNSVDQDTYSKLKEMVDLQWYSGFLVNMPVKEKADDKKLEEIARRVGTTNH